MHESHYSLSLNVVFVFPVSSMNLVGVFLEDGQVCTYYNFNTMGETYQSGDVIELPRRGKDCAVVILGIHGRIYVNLVLFEWNDCPAIALHCLEFIDVTENLAEAANQAKTYFTRICRWDNVTDKSTVKLFGYDLSVIEEEVSQIALFDSQGIEGMTITSIWFAVVGFVKILIEFLLQDQCFSLQTHLIYMMKMQQSPQFKRSILKNSSDLTSPCFYDIDIT